MPEIAAKQAPARARQGRAALLLALMAFVAYSYWIPRGPLANSDTRIALTRAIVERHTLAIDAYAAGLSDRSAYGGHYYTDKAPGVSLLAVPIYVALRLALPAPFFDAGLFFVVRYLLTVAVIGLPAALFAGLFYRFLLPMLGRRRAALLCLGYSLGTMAWALSALMFSHALTAACLFGAFMLLYPGAVNGHARSAGILPAWLQGRRDAGAPRTAPLPWWRWGLAGALCGLAVCLEYPAALVAAAVALLAVYAALKTGAWPAAARLAAFAAAAALAASPVPLFNQAMFGSPLSQGYAHLHGAAQFRLGMGHGVEGIGLPDPAALWGITFSPYRGLFVLSPFLLLAVPGLIAMWRRRRPAALVCGLAVAAMLLFNSAYYFWDGGVSLGPRHFTPALPFLTLPVAFAMRRAPWSRLAPWLIGLSMAIVALCCVTVLIFLPGVPDPIINLALTHLLEGPTPNNCGMLLGLRGPASLLPLGAIEAALAAALWRATRRPRRQGVSAQAVSAPSRAA